MYCIKQLTKNEMLFSSSLGNRGPKQSLHGMKVIKKMEQKKKKKLKRMLWLPSLEKMTQLTFLKAIS